MGEMLRLLPKAVSLIDELAIPEPRQPVASSAPSDKTATTPPVSSTPQPGLGAAVFSTHLGRRTPQGRQESRFVQPIARSDMVIDVVVGAEHLLRKYPYQYLNIFPQQGWQTGDLWDDYDIQTEGQLYFTEVLGFIERDNVVRVHKYACEYAQKYPERQTLIGGDMTELYDKANPLAIVNKLFVNGESRDYPPVFLWKVAHFLRTSMLAVKGITPPFKDVGNAAERPVVDLKDPALHSTVQVPASPEGSANVPADMSVAAIALAPVVKQATTTPTTHIIPTRHQERQSPRLPAGAPAHGRLATYVGPAGGIDYVESTGHMMPALPTYHAGGPNVAYPGLHNPRTRPGRSAPVLHDQIMSASPYIENMPRIASGLGLRSHADPMPMAHSPRHNHAYVAMNPMMDNVPPGMVPFGYDQGLMGHGMIANQPHPANVLYSGSVPHHAIQGAPIMHAYPRQTSNMQGPPFAMPMGDMTNTYYGGPSGMPMQDRDSRHPNERRPSQQHANGNALYDPYEGSNSTFRNTAYPGGRKYSQNGWHGSTGRQRKLSFPGNRPYYGQHTNGRPQAGGLHNSGPKPWAEDDRAITQDREYGCHVDWIGPQNETVNELFVKDLPENVQDAELEALFLDRLGVKPTSVNVRCSPHFPQTQGRRHAFVGFPTAAIAKRALVIHSPTIRGLPVSITVPKRFFQKTLDIPSRNVVEAGPSAYSRYTSNPNNLEGRDRDSVAHEGREITGSAAQTKEKMSYSPQDARSDLHKKKKGKQTQQVQTAAGSPETRKFKPKKRQEVPEKERPAAPTETIKTGAMDASFKDDGQGPAPIVMEKIASVVITQPHQPHADKAAPSTREEFKDPVYTQDVSSKLETCSALPGATPNDPLDAVLQRVGLETQQTVRPSTEIVVEERSTKPQANAEDTVAKPESSVSLEPEEPTSDDDLKNDASFHSAAESQSDLEVKAQRKVGSGIANHGTAVPVPGTTAVTTISSPTISTSALEDTRNNTFIPSKETVKHTASEDEPLRLEPKPATMPPADSKVAEVPAATQQEAKERTTVALVAEQAKKSGPQQTEGLGLYPSKKQREAQAKKEREQKKKAQKKEKELAQKAKVEKAAASRTNAKKTSADDAMVKADSADHTNSKLAADAESAGTNVDYTATTQDVGKRQASAMMPSSPETSHKTALDSRGDKLGKRKGKTADVPGTDDTAPAEAKSEDHGKQTNGASTPNETGSVTNKDVKAEPQEIAQEKPQDVAKGAALAPDAQSSNQDDIKKISSSAPESRVTVPSSEASTPSGKKKNKKKNKNPAATEGDEAASKPPPTWPNLEFRRKSPNPAWLGPIDMATDVHAYEEIMDKACGGPDDSEFSWSDLPTMDDVAPDEGDNSADLDVDEMERTKRYSQLLFPKVKKLQTDMAYEIMAQIIKVTTIEELAIFVTNNTALVAKVDEIVLFHQGKDAVDTNDSQHVITQPDSVVREETVDRGIAALEAQIAAKWEDLNEADVALGLAAFSDQFAQYTDSGGPSSTNEGRITALEAQLAATKLETAATEVRITALDKQRIERTADQEPSDSVSQESQPAKKKKANKHKNKKKKKKKLAENSESAETQDTAGNTGGIDLTPSKTAAGPIDPKDPFAHQMQEVDAVIEEGQHGGADAKASPQVRGSAATSTDESTLMRTMEAYFREAHPERKNKGRKFAQEDLH